jgi:hypothetical protein
LTIIAEEWKNAEELTYAKEELVGLLISCGRVFF